MNEIYFYNKMAKRKRTYTKKTYKVKRYKSFNKYFDALLQTTLTAEFTYNQAAQPPVRFGMFNGNIALNYGQTVSVLMQDCSTWPTYAGLFSQFLLKGIAVIATPVGNNTNSGYPGTIKIGLVGNNQGYDYNVVKDANYGMILSPLSKTKCWMPMIGQGIGWVRVGLPTDQPGAMQIARSLDNVFPDVGLFWTLEFRFYIKFKQSLY